MTAHLSDQLLQRYSASTLAPEELLTVDQHLEICEDCRQRLLESQLPPLPLAAPMQSVARLAAPQTDKKHLEYERLAAFVQGELSLEEHRQTEAHLKTCSACAWQVNELREFAATLNPYQHQQPPVPAWKRWMLFWRAPQNNPQTAPPLAEALPAFPPAAFRAPAPVEMAAPAPHRSMSRLPFFRQPLWQGAMALALLMLGIVVVWQLRRPATQVVQQTASPSPTITAEPRRDSTPVTTPAPERATPTPRTETPSVFAMMLTPLRARGEAARPNSFSLPANTIEVKITLTEIVKADADGQPYQRYVATLDQQGRKLRTNVIGNAVALTLPIAALRDGRHKLTLYGVTAEGNEEAIREYLFSITGRK